MAEAEIAQDRRLPSFSYAYQIFMLVLCVYAVLALAAGFAFPVSAEVKQVLQVADFVVCMVFLCDFCYSLYRSENRWGYFRTWGWIDLLSSIPMVDALRVGRFVRILRIIRVLRALRATKMIVGYWVARRAESAFYAVLAIAFSMLLFASISILQFEAEADGNIRTAEDALWWAIATITTVGYGDRYPVTVEGRLIAAVLMTAGVGLFGTLSGIVASWFLAPQKGDEQEQVAELRVAVTELREAVDRLGRAQETNLSDAQGPSNRSVEEN